MSAVARQQPTSSRFSAARWLACASIVAAVAVGFADSSIVVLALPDLLRRYGVSIMAVSWTITAYNVSLAAAAFVLARSDRLRSRPTLLARRGAIVFFAASSACAVAPGVLPLVAFRAVQGLGAAGLLVGSLPFLQGVAGRRGTQLWIGAGVIGAALGPAAGGLLTQVFSWRAIFIAQAPVAAAAVVATLHPVSHPDEAPTVERRPPRQGFANGVALSCASAALVGLLFLAVILLIDVWRFSPLRAAAVVSTIPIATLLTQRLGSGLQSGAVAAGSVLMGGGLVSLAFLPAVKAAWVVVSLVVAGIGVGLLLPRLTERALAGGGSIVERSARTIWIRHAGLVIGLLVLTPLLAANLSSAATNVKLRGIAIVLDSPTPPSSKLHLAVDLLPVLSRPAREGLPDFAQALAPAHQSALTKIGKQLDYVVQATVTRAFRWSFLLAALLGFLAVVPFLGLRRIRASAGTGRALPAVALAVIATLSLSEIASGATSFGENPRLLPPCARRPPPPAVDGRAQQVFLSGLDAVACRLHETREALVLHVAMEGRTGVRALTRLVGGTAKAGHLGSFLFNLIKSSLP